MSTQADKAMLDILAYRLAATTINLEDTPREEDDQEEGESRMDAAKRHIGTVGGYVKSGVAMVKDDIKNVKGTVVEKVSNFSKPNPDLQKTQFEKAVEEATQ